MKLSHVGIPVTDIGKSKDFYQRALAPLGMKVTMTIEPGQTKSGDTAIGFGTEGEPGFFWIGDKERVGEGVHVAFDAETCDQVDAFHKAALAAGGKDNGAPGLRPHYGPTYYAAFVLDPDGANIEAVCLAPS